MFKKNYISAKLHGVVEGVRFLSIRTGRKRNHLLARPSLIFFWDILSDYHLQNNLTDTKSQTADLIGKQAISSSRAEKYENIIFI